jgi:hypothetical protein
MHVSVSSLFDYQRVGCPCRVNGEFTGGSDAWPRGGASAWETNMAVTVQQRAQCVVWYEKFSSVIRTQRAFRRQYNNNHVPSHRDIVKWHMFLENGLTMPNTGGRGRDGNRKTFGRSWFRAHWSRCAACQLRETFHTIRVRGLSDGTSTCFRTT